MSGSLQAAAREAEETCDGLQSSVLSQSPAHTGAMGEGKGEAELRSSGYLQLNEGLRFPWIPDTEAGNAFH